MPDANADQIGAVDRRLLSVEDAARALSIGRTTAFAKIKSGELGSVQCGSRRLVPVEELDRFVRRLAEGSQ